MVTITSETNKREHMHNGNIPVALAPYVGSSSLKVDLAPSRQDKAHSGKRA